MKTLIAGALLAAANAGLHPLTTRQVNTLLRRAIIDFRDGGPNGQGASPTREFFWRNGKYTGEFDNYDAIGTYRISRGQVCVQEKMEGGCRALFVDTQRQYWIRAVPAGKPRRIWVRRIAGRR